MTLMCIHRALIVCPPSELELLIIATRIGHQRDFLLEQCAKVRAITTTTTATTRATTTVLTTTATSPKTTTTSTGSRGHMVTNHTSDTDNIQSHRTSDLDISDILDSNLESSEVKPVYEPNDEIIITSGEDKIKKQNSSNSEKNDPKKIFTNSTGIITEKSGDIIDVDVWCQTDEGRNSVGCLWQNASNYHQANYVLVLVVCSVINMFD